MLWAVEGGGLWRGKEHTGCLWVGERMSFLGASASPALEDRHCREERGETISSQVGRVGQAPSFSSLNTPVLSPV